MSATLWCDRRGNAAVELALVAPLMLLLLMGGFELTQIVRADMKLRQAAQTLADLVANAAQGSVTSTSLADFCTGARLEMSPFAGKLLSGAIAEVVNGQQTGKISVAWQDTSCGNAAAIANAATAAAPMVSNPGDSVIMVEASFAYQGASSYVLPASFALSRIAYARPRNVPMIAKN